MAATYTPIASITLGAEASSVTFSSIPQTYTDLILVGNYSLSGDISVSVRFNSDTGTNYSTTRLLGNGSTASSARTSSATSTNFNIANVTVTTTISNTILHIMNYSNTTTYKTTIGRANQSDSGTNIFTGLWRSTAAITSITLLTSSGTVSSGSTFNLYGILGANA